MGSFCATLHLGSMNLNFEKALFGEKEWYFFTPRDRKYPNGSRPNRAAGSGYWKATGADKPITTGGGGKRVGIKKALVFYSGKAPKGSKSNWIMHEYRLGEINRPAKKKGSLRLDDWVLCRIYNKKSSAEKLAMQQQECSMEETMESFQAIDEKEVENLPTLSSAMDSIEHSTMERSKPPSEHLCKLEPSSTNCNAISNNDSPGNYNIGSQNPFSQQDTNTFKAGFFANEVQLAPFNPVFPNQWTNYNPADLISGLQTDSSSSKPVSSDPISEKEEVQSSFRLENFLQEDHHFHRGRQIILLACVGSLWASRVHNIR